MEDVRELKDLKSFDDLPLILSANDLQRVLPMSKAGIYQIMAREELKVVKIGKRRLVMRDDLIRWLEETKGNTNG